MQEAPVTHLTIAPCILALGVVLALYTYHVRVGLKELQLVVEMSAWQSPCFLMCLHEVWRPNQLHDLKDRAVLACSLAMPMRAFSLQSGLPRFWHGSSTQGAR